MNCVLFLKNVRYNLFLWCKAGFSASLLQFSASHDPSEIIIIYWFAAQETFLIINAKNICWKIYIFVTFIVYDMYLLTLLINWIYPCWIKALHSLKKSYWPKPFQQCTVSTFLEPIRSHVWLIKSINWWTKCFESDWLVSRCSTELALIWTTKEKCLLNRN